jgi:hypothetical protein
MRRGKRYAGVVCFYAVALVLLCSMPSYAGVEYIKVDLPEYNHSLNNMTSGGAYGIGGDYVSLNGGVPFTIADGTNGTYNIWHSVDSVSHVLGIQTNAYGVDKVHTFINTWWGSYGANIGTVSFLGSGGATYSVDLVMGLNVRDHYQGVYVNEILSPMTSLAYSPGAGVILDRQEIILPDSFKTQTLVNITFTDTNLSNQSNGKFFLTALTLEKPIPEPTTLVLLAMGGLLLGRKRRV